MEKTWQTEIGAKTKLWNLNLSEIWQYKSLIWMLFKRNYSLQYKQTILGPFWVVFNVILSTGIFTLVFGYVGKMSSDGIPYFLFCISGKFDIRASGKDVLPTKYPLCPKLPPFDRETPLEPFCQNPSKTFSKASSIPFLRH